MVGGCFWERLRSPYEFGQMVVTAERVNVDVQLRVPGLERVRSAGDSAPVLELTKAQERATRSSARCEQRSRRRARRAATPPEVRC